MKRVGILAIQGDVAAHARALARLGAEAVPVLHEADLLSLDGLYPILPVVFYTGTRRWDCVGRLVDLVEMGAAFESATPAMAPLFINLPVISAEELEAKGGFFGWVLRLIQQRKSRPREFQRLLNRVVQHLESMPQAERRRWLELLSYIMALVYHVREPSEWPSLQEAVEASVQTDEHRQEVFEMRRTIADELKEEGAKKGALKTRQQAASWRPGFVIDIEKHALKKFTEPLVVIDPVDPNRNVAAAVSLNRLAGFVELTRGYCEKPACEFFLHPMERCILKKELAETIARRKTVVLGITFATPPFIPEVVVPQLKRSVSAICELLERNGFVVHHASYDMQKETCMILLELLVGDLPAIRLHLGPPLWNPVNADKFRNKHLSGELPGPFIEDGRYEMEVKREFQTAKSLLASPVLLTASLSAWNWPAACGPSTAQ